MITRKSKRELDLMRKANGVVAEVLALIGRLARPGVTTAELDNEARKLIKCRGCAPAFLGHGGRGRRPPFPASICTSVNHEVVHGIPDQRPLQEGDLLSVDVGTCWRKYYGDGAATYAIGTVARPARRLMDTCRRALELGIAAIGPGKRLSTLARTIQGYVESHGFSVVRDLVGHGIGTSLWEEPQVPNYVGSSLRDVVLRPGMVLAIEPMICAGDWRVSTLPNRWTVVAADGSLAAHFEHTVAITDDGVEILTVVADGGDN
ncbi:type I methionyl aminopeptidase [bacterium]|nr:type I methionyl aminopeptidase [bacterium]